MADALGLMNVTPGIIERLTIYEQLLRKWQAVENLVAPASLDHVWMRHFANSAQVLDIVPEGLVLGRSRIRGRISGNGSCHSAGRTRRFIRPSD